MQGGREQTEEAVVLVVCFFRLLCFQEITDTWWQQHNIMQEKKKSPALQQCDMLCSTVQTIQSMCCAFTGNALRHDFQTIREETDSRLSYNTSRAVRLTYFIARALVILPRWQKWRQWTKLYDISTLTVWKIKHTAIFYQSWKKIQIALLERASVLNMKVCLQDVWNCENTFIISSLIWSDGYSLIFLYI